MPTEKQTFELGILAVCLLILLATVLAGTVMVGVVVQHLRQMVSG